MNTNNSIIKTCMKIIVLLLLIMSISNVSYASTTYSGVEGVEAIVKTTDPKNVVNKTIFLGFGHLKASDYLYCIEYGQMMNSSGANYTISMCIDIDGDKATSMKTEGSNWVTASNSNMYNGILALILNSEGELGHGNNNGSGTAAQKALWSYFPYWIDHSGKEINVSDAWCSGSGWSAEYDGGKTGKSYLNAAMQAYANGERAKVRIYLLKNSNGTESWQRLMIAIPEGEATPPENDLIIKKVDKDTGETLSGVQFIIKNDENKYIKASGPDKDNIYKFTEFTTNESEATKFKTGTNSYKDIIIQQLPDDKYIIKEVNNPNSGYEVNVGKEYSVDKTDNENNDACVITIQNEKTEKLIIKKIDSDTQEALSGIEFTFKNDENKYVKASGPNSNNEYTFTGYTTEESEATRFKTGNSTYMPITILELPNDVYTVKEVSNPHAGYRQNVGYECTIEKKDSPTNADYVITIQNDKLEDLIIEKVDETTQEKLSGVEFILWNDDKQFIQASGPDENNVYTFTGYTDNGNDATRFITGTSDGYKPITIRELPNDTYTIKEMYNPILGYEVNELREWQIVKEDSPTNANCVVTLQNEEKPEPEDEHKQTTVKGKVTISGFVWEDIAPGKNNSINSQYDESEQRVEGIKVYWKDANGEIIDSTTTDANGYYEFSMELELYNHPYGIKDIDKYNRINTSYVEFDYNGIKYTTVANTSDITQENVSQGKEIEADREALDNKFDMIQNSQIIDNGTAVDNINNVNDYIETNYLEKFAVTATTNQIKNLLEIAESQDGWIKKTTFCTEHCAAGVREHEVGRIELNKDGASATIVLYCYGRSKVEKWNDIDGILEEEINSYINAPIGEEFNQYNAHYYSAGEIDGPIKKDCLSGEEHVYEWNIKNVNLGLVKREQPDIAITSDIEKVRVIMKDQEYTYIYGNRGIQDSDESFDYKVQFGNKYAETYSRPVNPADIAYVNQNNSDDLKVYVTYNIIAKNQSTTLYMTAQNIVNYYDSNYTIYKGDGTATSNGWVETSETSNGYKVAYNNSWNVKIAPGQKTELLKIEFEVNQETIKGLLNEDAPLKNVSEIVAYTTYYGETTLCAETEDAATKGKTGSQYAGIDLDSIPGNAIPGDVDTYEDDTDQAPSFLLCKDTENPDTPDEPDDSELEYKVISGTVWEDSQTTESAESNERLGNGVKEDSENGVANVKVELLLADGSIAKLYRIEDGEIKTSDAITYTDENGNYSFGNNSTDSREGVVTDEYIIRYTYGDNTTINGHKINGRNYKSTIITTSPVEDVMKGTSNDDKWHLTTPDNASIAVDNLDDRLAIPSLQYSNFDDPIIITAESKPFKVQIEYTEDQESQVDSNGGEFEHDWTRFDFGVIERPREDIVVDKTISHVKLTLANGQVLIEGDPRIDTMSYAKALGFNDIINNREESLSALDKLLSIEMDSELIQGATLNVTFAVTVTNNSEIDYEYDSSMGGNEKYYYYGENPTNIIKQSVELLVDYIDSELVCKVGENAEDENNKKWYTTLGGEQITADYLKDNGYISFKKQEEDSDRTYETLKNGDYTILVTEEFKELAPGESKSQYLSASKLLANQEESNLYDNHVEILKLNGKIARTIDSVNNGEQIVKTYKPGNYIPSLTDRTTNSDGTLELVGLHQPDDDRVRIVITPPTGTSNYITTYIITAVVGLIVIVGGIFFIKKKIMNK